MKSKYISNFYNFLYELPLPLVNFHHSFRLSCWKQKDTEQLGNDADPYLKDISQPIANWKKIIQGWYFNITTVNDATYCRYLLLKIHHLPPSFYFGWLDGWWHVFIWKSMAVLYGVKLNVITGGWQQKLVISRNGSSQQHNFSAATDHAAIQLSHSGLIDLSTTYTR